MLCPGHIIPLTNVAILFSHDLHGHSRARKLPYRIELWDDRDTRVEELIALVADHAVARAAFVEAVRRRPGNVIILRQKSRVLADSRR
jgi:hypothetical protein